MQRLTISLDDDLAEAFDVYTRQHGYENRSEAFRDLVRERLGRESVHKASPQQFCVATVSYVYDHHERQLAQRVTSSQHENHDLCVSALHVHLDHDNCLEIMVLRGPLTTVRGYAESFVAQPGVRHGSVHIVPVDAEVKAHSHRHIHDHSNVRVHLHSRPVT